MSIVRHRAELLVNSARRGELVLLFIEGMSAVEWMRSTNPGHCAFAVWYYFVVYNEYIVVIVIFLVPVQCDSAPLRHAWDVAAPLSGRNNLVSEPEPP